MATSRAPPPDYTGNGELPASKGAQVSGPFPDPPSQQATVIATNRCAYWSYWSFLLTSPLTWVFAVTGATASWTTDGYQPLHAECDSYDGGSACEHLEAAQALQYLAVILVTTVFVLAMVAACMGPRLAGRLGIAAGIILAVFALFELITFSLMTAVLETFDLKAGPAYGVTVTAFLLGTVASVLILVLWRCGARGQDGPCRSCCCQPSATGAPAVGTV